MPKITRFCLSFLLISLLGTEALCAQTPATTKEVPDPNSASPESTPPNPAPPRIPAAQDAAAAQPLAPPAPEPQPAFEPLQGLDSLNSLATSASQQNPSPKNSAGIPTNSLAFFKSLAGQYDTDLFTGSATFTYPLQIPAGRNNLAPKLFLKYSSLQRRLDSFTGYGWQLPTNAIFRSTAKGVDKLYTEALFSADLFGETEELIVTNAAQGLYAPKIEGSFTQFKLQNNTWLATDTLGTQYFFGPTAASRQTDPNDPSRIYKWLLERVEDRNGNFVTCTYFKDRGQIYPEVIRYTGHGETAGSYEIKFVLAERPAGPTLYNTGFKVQTRYRLQKIQVYAAQELAYEYVFTYHATGKVIETLASLTIQKEEAALPPFQFSYYTGAEDLPSQKIHFLKKITYPLGGTAELVYKPSTAYRTKAQGLANANLPFSIPTIHTVTTQAQEAGPTSTTTYTYAGGHYYFDSADSFKREYVGFHEVHATEPTAA